MSNVVNFPKRFDDEKSKPFTKQQMSQNIRDFRMGYIDDVSEFISNITLMEMDRAGFNFEESDMPDILFVRDSLRSLMMKKQGFAHPIQELISESMKVDDEEEDLTDDENDDINTTEE